MVIWALKDAKSAAWSAHVQGLYMLQPGPIQPRLVQLGPVHRKPPQSANRKPRTAKRKAQSAAFGDAAARPHHRIFNSTYTVLCCTGVRWQRRSHRVLCAMTPLSPWLPKPSPGTPQRCHPSLRGLQRCHPQAGWTVTGWVRMLLGYCVHHRPFGASSSCPRCLLMPTWRADMPHVTLHRCAALVCLTTCTPRESTS